MKKIMSLIVLFLFVIIALDAGSSSRDVRRAIVEYQELCKDDRSAAFISETEISLIFNEEPLEVIGRIGGLDPESFFTEEYPDENKSYLEWLVGKRPTLFFTCEAKGKIIKKENNGGHGYQVQPSVEMFDLSGTLGMSGIPLGTVEAKIEDDAFYGSYDIRGIGRDSVSLSGEYDGQEKQFYTENAIYPYVFLSDIYRKLITSTCEYEDISVSGIKKSDPVMKYVPQSFTQDGTALFRISFENSMGEGEDIVYDMAYGRAISLRPEWGDNITDLSNGDRISGGYGNKKETKKSINTTELLVALDRNGNLCGALLPSELNLYGEGFWIIVGAMTWIPGNAEGGERISVVQWKML